MINTSVFQDKKAAYFTLGCKLNFSETSTFGKMLADLGVHVAEEGEVADICLVNTCSVTEVADHKCRQAIHRLVRNNPGAFVVVTGCYAQLESESVSKIDGVDLVLGSDEKANLIQFLSDAWTSKESAAERDEDGKAESLHEFHSVKTKMIKSFAPSCSRGNRTRYFLKVQDGCDYYCTYCTIPYARGNSRNPTIASLVAQAEEAAREGGKEIVLTGVNIGDFGKTTGESFLDLCKALELIKQKMPDAFIGVDVMVGCRGETPECFEECYEFLDGVDVTQLHVFPYSERPGTAALRIPYVVDDAEKKVRSKRLLDLSEQKRINFYTRYIGTEQEVLFEKATRGKAMHGFTANYIRVELPAKLAKEEYDNQILRVRLGEFNRDKSALQVELL